MSAFEQRYDRQTRLPQIGKKGQYALSRAKVAMVGLGALGSVTADLLARAGVGELLLIDRDVVDWSNLQRQMLYVEADAKAARPKASAAAERLQKINSSVSYQVLATDLTAQNLSENFSGVSLIVDGTDNFGTRYLLNDYAVKHQVPFIYAGVVSTYGMVGSIVPGAGPCLRCTYPEPPAAAHAPTCRSAGVLGPAVSVIAGLAAAEAIKVIVQADADFGFRYLDVWSNQSNFLRASKDPDCPCCAQLDFAWLEGRLGGRGPEVLCGGNTVQVPPSGDALDLVALTAKLQGTVDGLQSSEHFLRFTQDGLDVVVFADGRALIRGTEDPQKARSLLAETIGS